MYDPGRVSVKGAEEMKSLSLADIARRAYWAHHIAVLDVDVATGKIDWVKYVAVDDCGTIINPLLVEGQIHGALAQGLGGALLEEFVYDDETGQLLSSSLMDYLLPTFTDLPEFDMHHLVTPSPHTEGGFKGTGEAGCFPAAPAVANAVADALAEFGIEVDRTPVTPNRVWRLIQEAGA